MSNENLPIGPKTPDFEAPWPGKPTLKGKFVTLEPLSNDHAEDLFECLGGQENEYLFTYIPEGPWPDYESFLASIEAKVKHQTWMYLALVDPHTHRAIGYVSLMNIIPKFRTVEVGNVMFSPQIQRSPAGTECNYLLARYIFDLNYRRFEWKANSLNAKSRRAAERRMSKSPEQYFLIALVHECIVSRGQRTFLWKQFPPETNPPLPLKIYKQAS